MSLSALPAFTDDCISTIDARAFATIVDPRASRRPALAAILVTRRAGAGHRQNRAVREQGRSAAHGPHTGGHIAYYSRARTSKSIAARRATLLASRRERSTDALAAPRAWKNDFR